MKLVRLGLTIVAGFLVLNIVIALCAHTYDPTTGAKRPLKQRLILHAAELLSWFAFSLW
jgi:hypothetical protein